MVDLRGVVLREVDCDFGKACSIASCQNKKRDLVKEDV
jgi:hypothetical protein